MSKQLPAVGLGGAFEYRLKHTLDLWVQALTLVLPHHPIASDGITATDLPWQKGLEDLSDLSQPYYLRIYKLESKDFHLHLASLSSVNTFKDRQRWKKSKF